MTSQLKSLAALSLFATFLLSFIAVDASAAESRRLTVVELFTSQGCSSCPPADAYLGDLAQRDESEGVLALSFHVDYWDNLGWKDPFSSADNTRRQRAYAQYMDLRYVYTPQMIIHGAFQATGSDRMNIERRIESARELPSIEIELTRNGRSLQVNLPEATRPANADVFMAVYDKEHVTDIKRGENRGKSITNRNVVRSLKRIGTWQGQALSLSSPLGDSGDSCAIIVQSRETGAILGAASIVLN